MASTQVVHVGGRRLREARASSQDSAEKEKTVPTIAVQQAFILDAERALTLNSHKATERLTNFE